MKLIASKFMIYKIKFKKFTTLKSRCIYSAYIRLINGSEENISLCHKIKEENNTLTTIYRPMRLILFSHRKEKFNL